MHDQFDPSGAFTPHFALSRLQQGQWHFDLPLAEALKAHIGSRTVLDLGAGIGRYCEFLNCRGIDGVPGIEQLSNGRVSYGNLIDPELQLPEHEVALCLEVAEHIPRAGETIFLGHLTQSAHEIILSWGAPGQAGVGHVNCRTPREVISLLADRGLTLNQQITTSLRAIARTSWFRSNLMVFEKGSAATSSPCKDARREHA